MEKYNKRIFGSIVVKAINSNYNADFSGQPRTLPNGKVYATDKALKYANCEITFSADALRIY